MKYLQSLVAITAAVFFSTSAIAEDAKPAEWLFVHTAQTAEMTSDTTLVMPATRDRDRSYREVVLAVCAG